VRRHGRPAEGRHAIQVEVNKRLYMHEDTLAPHAGFKLVQHTLREMARQLIALDLQALGPQILPLA